MNDPGDSALAASADDSPTDSEPPERLSITIIAEAGDWSGFAAHDEAIAGAAAALARHPRCLHAGDAEANIVLGDDDLVRSLNAAYRGKDSPTNVLSFPFKAPPGVEKCGLLGDVVLAAETIAREAAEQGVLPVHHLQHLVIHGLLHLLGFDHATDAQAEDMEQLEIEILASLGIANPYAPGFEMKVP